MSSVKQWSYWAIAMAMMSFGLSLDAGDAEKGKGLWATCAACHGAEGQGNEMMKAPALAGLQDWYIKSQMKKFKEGVRGGNPKDAMGMQMKAMAMVLDDAGVEDVLAFLKTQPKVKSPAKLKGDPNKGKMHYMTCQACHGAKGEGNKMMKAPALAGLPDWYIVAQLIKFKEGIRGAHPSDVEGMQMRPMATILPDEAAMENVAAYIQSL